ncbi:hypothetical protein HanHA300_Chr10g0352191 [Helianthus annuus]|nr:hypothetical protein HanHA300_Chr10g0352191 [Helianthus annuus]KAJ0529094.1 hypothetical protein HanHA89_Chr10g0373841 [Helianthus annuus]
MDRTTLFYLILGTFIILNAAVLAPTTTISPTKPQSTPFAKTTNKKIHRPLIRIIFQTCS